jgi:hypothetical protein
LFVGSAHAVDFEASIGKTANTHELSYSIGIIGEAYGQEVRAGYANLGSNNMGSPVAADDYADDAMAGWGQPPCHWLKQKELKELYLTVAPVIYRGAYLWQIELGAAAYHPQWQQDICVNAANEPAHAYGNPWGITPIIGLIVGDGKTSVALQYQNITERGDWENSEPRSAVINLSLRRRF